MQTRLSIISNLIFKYFALFSIAFMWLNFYSTNNIFVTFISIIIALIIGNLLGLISKYKKKKINLSLIENNKIQEISFQLLINSHKENLKFFHILLKSKNICEINFKKNQIESEEFIFVPIYNSEEITESDILNIYKNNINVKKIIISCISFSTSTESLCNKLQNAKIYLLDIKQTFVLMKKYDLYPEITNKINIKKHLNFASLKKMFFAKQNSKRYFFSGIIILLTSFFIRYNIYYLISATLLFIFSLICKIKPSSIKLSIIEEL